MRDIIQYIIIYYFKSQIKLNFTAYINQFTAAIAIKRFTCILIFPYTYKSYLFRQMK